MRKLVATLTASVCLFSTFVCVGENAGISTEDAIKSSLQIAKSRYVGLLSRNVRTESDKVNVGSAFMINCTYMVSNFHLLIADYRLTDMNGDKKTPIVSVGMNVEHDVLVLKSNTPNHNLSRIEFAEKVDLGEVLVSYSNAEGTNGFARVYRVAKLSDTFVFLDQPSLPGESGSVLLNLKGQFAGLINSTAASETGERLYGRAIYPSVVKLTIDKVIPENIDCE